MAICHRSMPNRHGSARLSVARLARQLLSIGVPQIEKDFVLLVWDFYVVLIRPISTRISEYAQAKFFG